MTQAQEIINTLTALGGTVRADGSALVVAPKSKVPAELAPEMRQGVWGKSLPAQCPHRPSPVPPPGRELLAYRPTPSLA
jgi:hypothetical protein